MTEKAGPMSSILFVTNWDWVFHNFRRSLAHSLRRRGVEVGVVCPCGEYVESIQEEGFEWIEWRLSRKSLNPLREIRSLVQLANIYERLDPDFVHHDTIKPNLYGTIALRLNRLRSGGAPMPHVINSFMGIGFLFSDQWLAQVLRAGVVPMMRWAMHGPHVYTTFSNWDDRDTFIDLGLVRPDRTQVIVSEFVDTDKFTAPAEEDSSSRPVRVLMAARLLWEKGVGEFVEAARQLRAEGYPVEFWIAGEPDTETPGYVPEDQLRTWDQEEEGVRWLGYCSDMPSLLSRVDIAALPTHYNEGLPRFLVESASAGLPVVTTDLAACRRVVEPGENGILIPAERPDHLADAVRQLVKDDQLRRDMGRSSRKKAVREFEAEYVIQDWLELYRRLA
jgi:glycosyltransferase involved in cell wall biosynthesis